MVNMIINSYQNNKAEHAGNMIPLLTIMLPKREVNTMTIPTLSENTVVSQEPEITEELLTELFLDKKLRMVDIAAIFKRNVKYIRKRVREFGLEREKSESSREKMNLAGRVFERLTVLEEHKSTKRGRFWKCQCSCGNIIICQQSNLLSGISKSCGCLRKEIAQERYSHDLTGQRVGRLVVLTRENPSPSGARRWKCLCDCGNTIITYASNLAKGHTQSCGCLQKEQTSGEKHHKYVGGSQFTSYEFAKESIGFAEEIRRDPDNLKAVQVKCAYCNQWFSPTMRQVHGRRLALHKKSRGEARFYCSDNCRKSCPTYKTIKYPKGFKKASSREVNPVLRHIVLERDGYECQKCGATISDQPLHVHHVKSFTLNRILGDDPDNCITLCKACHKKVHQVDECKYNNLKCEKE